MAASVSEKTVRWIFRNQKIKIHSLDDSERIILYIL